MVSVSATVLPRLRASSMRSRVSSGVLDCTKWTSAGSVMPASAIAARTPSATFSTIGSRPISSGRIGSDMATPTASRFSSLAPPSPGTRAKTFMWGAITPSVPPDHTIGIWSISDGGRVP